MIQIREKSEAENWEPIRNSFYKSLTSPFDGMWDELAHDHSQLWGFYDNDQIVGYCCKDIKGNLINFFVQDNYSAYKTDLFKRVLYLLEIRQAIVSTNNPGFLVVSLDKSKKMSVHAFLFESDKEMNLPKPRKIENLGLEPAKMSDIEDLIKFCTNNTDADVDGFENYLNRLVDRQEIHLIKKDNKIIASCEIRESTSQPNLVDLGVIVENNYRKNGIGSWLIYRAKAMSIAQGKVPICSCEHENIASKKMIENAGFISTNMILKIAF